MTKIILEKIVLNLLTAIICFFVTKGVIEADVASKLMRGETTQLYGTGISLNLSMVVNVLVGLALPIIAPIAIGVWIRVKNAYATIVARSEAFATTKTELKQAVSGASVGEIIRTVAKENPA